MSNYIKKLEIIKFPAGEVQVRFPDLYHNTIFAKIKNNDDLIATYQAVRLLGKNKDCNLFIPYFPSSRQDKAHITTEGVTLQDIAYLFLRAHIYTLDIHNPGIVYVTENYSISKWLPLEFFQDYEKIIVWPDKSAQKRADLLNFHCFSFEKTRDPLTGKISNIKPTSPIPIGKTYYVIDDICDGGGTFIPIAEQIREVNKDAKIILATSHAMYSKGTDILLEHFDQLWTTDSWINKSIATDRIKIFPIFDMLRPIFTDDYVHGIGDI